MEHLLALERAALWDSLEKLIQLELLQVCNIEVARYEGRCCLSKQFISLGKITITVSRWKRNVGNESKTRAVPKDRDKYKEEGLINGSGIVAKTSDGFDGSDLL